MITSNSLTGEYDETLEKNVNRYLQFLELIDL
jgi:hypothetical protein